MANLRQSQPRIAPAWTPRLKSGRSFQAPGTSTIGPGKPRVERERFFEFSAIRFHPATRKMPLAKCENPFRYCSCVEQLSRNAAVGPIHGKQSVKRRVTSAHFQFATTGNSCLLTLDSGRGSDYSVDTPQYDMSTRFESENRGSDYSVDTP